MKRRNFVQKLSALAKATPMPEMNGGMQNNKEKGNITALEIKDREHLIRAFTQPQTLYYKISAGKPISGTCPWRHCREEKKTIRRLPVWNVLAGRMPEWLLRPNCLGLYNRRKINKNTSTFLFSVGNALLRK